MGGAYSESVVDSCTDAPCPLHLSRQHDVAETFCQNLGQTKTKMSKYTANIFRVLTFCVAILRIYQNSNMQCKDQFCMSSINPFLGHRTTVL